MKDRETIMLDAINKALAKWGIRKKLSFDDGLELLTNLQDELLPLAEPYELPTEEEIGKLLSEYEDIMTEFLIGIDVDAGQANEARRIFIEAITNLLKGER